MKILINLILLALIAAFAYLLVTGIEEPIKFNEEKEKRKDAVAEKLTEIRTAQEIYRDINGRFAFNFDELISSLRNDSIPFTQVFNDPNDPNNEDKYVYKTIYSSARDSIKNLGIDLDDLKYVPYTDNSVTFDFFGDTIEYQKTKVPVTEVGTQWKNFMGPYADLKYTKYDKNYDPSAIIKFGDKGSPNLSGNWE